MLRKFFWLLATLFGAWSIVAVLDHHRRRQRRELWAEATDNI